MNEFDRALAIVCRGAKWMVDFQGKTVYINDKPLNNEGDYGTIANDFDEALTKIECLFHSYYHSVPSEKSEARHAVYFKALPYEKLSDNDLMYGESRDIAQFRLEFTILRLIIDGVITWDRLAEPKHWFWQSEKYPQFVMLREWIE